MSAVNQLKKYVSKFEELKFGEFEYKIINFIAQGGQAVVYQAFSVFDNANVTMRVFIKKSDEQQWQRQKFQLEAQQHVYPYIQRSIRYHEQIIVQKPQTPITDKIAIFQMLEYAPKRLGDIDFEELDLEQQKQIIRQVATALYSLHDQGVIHRDIKPDNILMSESDQVLLSDLGIARSDDGMMKTLIGTPAWCAPEVWVGILQGDDYVAVYGHQADAWSLGCVIYALFTDIVLFAEKSYKQIKELIDHVDFDIISDEEVKMWCKMMLVFDPVQRKENWWKIRPSLATTK